MSGEGFAYFQWHSWMWPESSGCTQCDTYLCVRIWKEMRAARRRGLKDKDDRIVEVEKALRAVRPAVPADLVLSWALQIEAAYSDLPASQYPGPPTDLVRRMRQAAGSRLL